MDKILVILLIAILVIACLFTLPIIGDLLGFAFDTLVEIGQEMK